MDMDAGQTTFADEELRQLKTDLEVTKTKLRQREEALGVLNRRLLSLERRSPDNARDPTTALTIAERDALTGQNKLLIEELALAIGERDALAAQNKLLIDEVELMRKTKLFRYAAPLRRIYALTKQA